MATLRLSLSFQMVHEGAVASVTMRYATRFCGPSTEQFKMVELNDVKAKVTLSGCIDLGIEVEMGRDGRAPKIEGGESESSPQGCELPLPACDQPPLAKGFML